MKPAIRIFSTMVMVVLTAAVTVRAQEPPRPPTAWPAHLIVPQARSPVLAPGGVGIPGTRPATAAEVISVALTVSVVEQVATTTLDVHLTNRSAARIEAELLVPVPAQAVLRGFDFHGAGREPSATVLGREEARALYDSIVARTRDPALLEFVSYRLVRSSVFPVEGQGGQTLRLIYEEVLPADGDRVDYVLPRTESLAYGVPWTIRGELEVRGRIGTVYSPSHAIETERVKANRVTFRTGTTADTTPGAFRLSYVLERDGIAASLMAYPDPKVGGGYFLLLGSVPGGGTAGTAPGTGEAGAGQKREVILVLDRSGSMAEEKLEQARAAAMQVLEGLAEGEAFNVVVYDNTVQLFAPAVVRKDAATMQAVREFLRGLRPGGGTNLHDALAEALRMPATPGALPLVLFLTDGLPTAGERSERAIRVLAEKGNPHQRRVFTFGVGTDVNTPLLDGMARVTRAVPTYVLPNEDVEAKVAQVFRRLHGPALAAPQLVAVGPDGEPQPGRVLELQPAALTDLFEGDQWIVLGQYRGEGPIEFRLTGQAGGTQRSYRMRFGLERATTGNAFIPRLWASRRIGVLTDAIRDLGIDAGPPVPGVDNRIRSGQAVNARMSGGRGAVVAGSRTGVGGASPEWNEMVSEIVKLSREFGVLTEYTSFLALEGTDLAQADRVMEAATRNLMQRAVGTRTGSGAVNQAMNIAVQQSQMVLNLRNRLVTEDLSAVEFASVQQVNNRAFFRRQGQWMETDVATNEHRRPDREVRIGTPEFGELVDRLAAEGRLGVMSLQGEILLRIGNETVLVK